MEKTMERYGVNHHFSTSYHPQTSGQVENTNRALKRILEETVKDNPAIWSRKLDDALWDFRTAYKTLTGTDKTNITRKPSKTGKHGYENGRVCKSRKPKSKKLDVIKDPHWSIPQGECHVGHEKTPRSGFLYSGYSQKKHRGHITDCHVGNPCVHKYDPTNIIRDPIIEGIQGVRLEGAWEALKGLEGTDISQKEKKPSKKRQRADYANLGNFIYKRTKGEKENEKKKEVDGLFRCKTAVEYVYHLEQARNYIENQIVWESREEEMIPHVLDKEALIAEVIGVNNEQGYRQDFMEEIIVKRADGNAYIFLESDYKYLNKNDIEDVHLIIVYENSKKERRVMNIEELPKLCDATLSKVLKKVKEINVEALYGFKDPPLTDDLKGNKEEEVWEARPMGRDKAKKCRKTTGVIFGIKAMRPIFEAVMIFGCGDNEATKNFKDRGLVDLLLHNYMSNLIDDVLLRKCLYIRDCGRLRNMYLSFHHEFISMDHEHEVLNLDSAGTRKIQFKRISLIGFLAQSVRSSNVIALDSLYLLVLITGASQSRQHVNTSLIHIEFCKPPTKSLFDVGSSRISIVTVNTKEYHSDVLEVITRIMRRTF
ncbi:reverse transcriptase domain-containing protein [Tanacetum coccineum]